MDKLNMELLEKCKNDYIELSERYENWWGWEDGYTYEESSAFYEGVVEESLMILSQVFSHKGN